MAAHENKAPTWASKEGWINCNHLPDSNVSRIRISSLYLDPEGQIDLEYRMNNGRKEKIVDTWDNIQTQLTESSLLGTDSKLSSAVIESLASQAANTPHATRSIA